MRAESVVSKHGLSGLTCLFRSFWAGPTARTTQDVLLLTLPQREQDVASTKWNR